MSAWFIIADEHGHMFLPVPTDGESNTSVEPTSLGTPRLFPSVQSARAALVAWLRGKFVVKYEGDSYFAEAEPVTVPEPKPHRKELGMSVYAVKVHIAYEAWRPKV